MKKSNISLVHHVIVLGFIFASCSPLQESNLPSLATPVQTPTKAPKNTSTVEAAATLYDKVLNPNTLFSTSGLQLLNTPSSTDFCEHIPQPEVGKGDKELVKISGRVALCVSRNWDIAFDLDTGSLVTSEDPSGDIQLLRDKAALASEPFYYLYGVNGAVIEEIGTSSITSKSCENLSLLAIPPVVFFVNTEGAIACVLTTNHQVALIRVEHIYPLDTDSIEFSFAILKR